MMRRRLGLLVAALAATAALGGVGNGSIGGPGSAVGGGTVTSGSTGAGGSVAAACGDWPSGFAYVFDADDIDGNNTYNSAYVNGGLVTTWVNDGGGVTGNLSAPTIGSSDTYKPYVSTSVLNGKTVVSFDVNDIRGIASSTTGASFFHETGIFDVILVMRKDITTTFYPLASTGTSAENGILVGANSTGTFSFLLLRGSSGTNNLNFTSTFTMGANTWTTVEFRGDGTTFRAAKNFGSYETASFTNKPFTAGAAANNLHVGHYPPGAGLMDGAVAVLLIASSELSAGDRATVQAVIGCRYGI